MNTLGRRNPLHVLEMPFKQADRRDSRQIVLANLHIASASIPTQGRVQAATLGMRELLHVPWRADVVHYFSVAHRIFTVGR
jgi:hypothetical protein